MIIMRRNIAIAIYLILCTFSLFLYEWLYCITTQNSIMITQDTEQNTTIEFKEEYLVKLGTPSRENESKTEVVTYWEEPKQANTPSQTTTEQTTQAPAETTTQAPAQVQKSYPAFDDELREYTIYVAQAYGIDPAIIFAMIQIESGYNVNAYNGGCVGLMQISLTLTNWLSSAIGISDLRDPYDNIKSGCFILRYYMDKGYTIEQALVCYNVGHLCANSTPYSQKVLAVAEQYR